jgi:hypothetical protein
MIQFIAYQQYIVGNYKVIGTYANITTNNHMWNSSLVKKIIYSIHYLCFNTLYRELEQW